MAPTKRKALRKNIQLRDENGDEYADGSSEASERIKLEVNELGQLIGNSTGQFSEFLGTVAKNGAYAPINIKRWKEMPDTKKQEMVDIVKRKFVVPPGMEDSILQSLAKRWRNWKSDLKTKYFDVNVPIDVQLQVGDVRVNKEQWVQLMTYWKTKDAQVLSMRNKEVRKKKKMNHRTGKKSFARVAVQMKSTSGNSPSRVTLFKKCNTDKSGNPISNEVAVAIVDMDKKISDLSSGSSDRIGRNDIFAQVIGKDRNGRVRMMGGGVAPTDIWSKVPSQRTCYRQAMEQKTAFEEMKSKYTDVLEQLKVQEARFSKFEAMANQQRANGSTHNSGFLSATQSLHQPLNHCGLTEIFPCIGSDYYAMKNQMMLSTVGCMLINSFVSLRSLFDMSKVVATGYLQSLDPTEIVGGHVLGENWCAVLVQVSVEGSEMLIRPYDMFQRIRDVLGCPIAWPTNLVVPEQSFI